MFPGGQQANQEPAMLVASSRGDLQRSLPSPSSLGFSDSGIFALCGGVGTHTQILDFFYMLVPKHLNDFLGTPPV